MIPPFIRKILIVTTLVVLVVWSYLALRDWRLGAAFLGASVWTMANFVVWSVLIVTATSRDVQAKGAKVTLLVLAKIAVLVGGPLSLIWFRPSTRGQIFAILAGISVVIVVTGLKAVGAWMTGKDVFGARAKFPLSLRPPDSESK